MQSGPCSDFAHASSTGAGTSIGLAVDGWPYQAVLAGQVALIVAAAAGQPVARYYTLVSWATVQALANYLRRGVPAVWDPAATR